MHSRASWTLAIAHTLTVYPDVECRHDTLEAQEGLTAVLVSVTGHALLLYLEFFKFNVLSLYLDCIGTCINLGACSCRQHLKLVRCRGECDVTVHKYRAFRVRNGHTCLDGSTTCILITEAKGIFLTQARLDDEGIVLFGHWLINGSWTDLGILWQLFLRQFGNGVSVESAPGGPRSPKRIG